MLENVCNLFDNSFELHGRKKKENDTTLLKALENIYFNQRDELLASEIGWVIWMYGKTVKQLENYDPNTEILEVYNGVEKFYDSINKQIVDKYKCTSMYAVMNATTTLPGTL